LVVCFPPLDITARRKKSGDSLVANPSTTTCQHLTHKLTIKNQKLKENQFEQVKNLSLSGLKPSDILQVMK
jgi:predicted solute-binding protein